MQRIFVSSFAEPDLPSIQAVQSARISADGAIRRRARLA